MSWQKSGLATAKFLSVRGWQASSGWVLELALIRRFLVDWFKFPLLREPKLQLSLGLVTRERLSISNSNLGWLSCF